MKHGSALYREFPTARHSVLNRDTKIFAYSKNIDPFEYFGVCGYCEVVSTNGLLSLRNLKAGDRVVTRNSGFSTVHSVLIKRADREDTASYSVITIGIGCLGEGLPQSELTLSPRNIAYRYLPQNTTQCQPIISMELAPGQQVSPLRNNITDYLCVPIFPNPTELFIFGAYVRCPSIKELNFSDLGKDSSLGTSNSKTAK